MVECKNNIIDEIQRADDPFPMKLHRMLEDMEKKGKQDILSWNEDGLSFSIYQPKVFADTIMRQCFRQTRYKSFQRQLNLYDFTRKTVGKIKGVYSHTLFVRDERGLCRCIRRTRGPAIDVSKVHLKIKEASNPQGPSPSPKGGGWNATFEWTPIGKLEATTHFEEEKMGISMIKEDDENNATLTVSATGIKYRQNNEPFISLPKCFSSPFLPNRSCHRQITQKPGETSSRNDSIGTIDDLDNLEDQYLLGEEDQKTQSSNLVAQL